MPQEMPKLGELITEDEDRDAIHIAIAPVVAGDYLHPGQHVGLTDGDTVVGFHSDPIGVVDPFLRGSVFRGQKFWLFLYPSTITSLKHHWEHPQFHPKITKKSKREFSEAWLRDFADDYYVSYDELMDETKRSIEIGELCIMCLGSSIDVDYAQFWYHYQVVTEQIIDPDKMSEMYFICSC